MSEKNTASSNTTEEVLDEPLADDDFQLDQALFYHTARVSSGMTRNFRARSGKAQCSPDERRIILCLGHFGPRPAIRIADETYMDRARVSRALPKLEQQGLVVRLADAKDKRRAIVKLTRKGAELHSRITGILGEREAAIFEDWDPADREMLLTLMTRVYDRLQEMNEEIYE